MTTSRQWADPRTKWVVAGIILLVLAVLSWTQTPVTEASDNAHPVQTLGFILVLALPPGVVIAVLAGRFAPRNRITRAVAWIATVLFGLWLFGVIYLAAFWSGTLCFGSPPCPVGNAVPSRLLGLVAAGAILGTCVLIERRAAGKVTPDVSDSSV